MELKKAVFLMLVLAMFTILWYYQGKEEINSAEFILEKNNIGFTGHIISYNKSTNHSYGVIKFKVIKSNKESFKVAGPGTTLSLQVRKRLWRVLWLYTF